MLPVPFQNALVLSGPTGSGKTDLGIEIAERIGAEIVSMDSMALYRGMDVGTAKPNPKERLRVPQHLIDVLDPWESANVAWWRERAAERCREIEGRGKRVLIVGGTALYLKALLLGLFEGPPRNPELRRRLEEQAERDGTSALYTRLAEIDSVAAGRIHPHDLRRIVRALEVWEVTGKPISHWQSQWGRAEADALAADVQVVWLDLPREELYDRINRRVVRMIEDGLVEEARTLRRLPHPLSREAGQALGYREVFDYLDGRATLAATVERIQARSRQFAKRQVTWFRHIPGCHPAGREQVLRHWCSTARPG